MVGLIGGVLGSVLTPSNANGVTQTAYGGLGALLVALAIIGLTFVIALAMAPYKQRNEARQQNVDLDTTLKQVREEIQNTTGDRLIEIPEILSEISEFIIRIVEKRKKLKPSTQELLEVAIELLDVEEDDYIQSP